MAIVNVERKEKGEGKLVNLEREGEEGQTCIQHHVKTSTLWSRHII